MFCFKVVTLRPYFYELIIANHAEGLGLLTAQAPADLLALFKTLQGPCLQAIVHTESAKVDAPDDALDPLKDIRVAAGGQIPEALCLGLL